MTIARLVILNAAALAVSISSSYAGPCPPGMEGMRASIAARLAAWPSAPQSIAAQTHRQPTQASVAAAEKALARRSGVVALGGIRRARTKRWWRAPVNSLT